MRPSVVLLGFLLGSSAAISFSLAGVTIVFVLLVSDYPRLADEIRPLLLNLGLFAALTAAAGISFYGVLRARAWRRPAVAGTLAVLALAIRVYWPT